ncbi:MAG: NAD(P)-dependent oxidoreductase [Candidatus Levybacteria bacterium]|nr:NAD(P)-dependent oxidoreductase [Candidatus Levybacteria bacterium]
MNSKILVTGGMGTVGSYAKAAFNESAVFIMGRMDLDITNVNQIKKVFDKIKPTVVIHLAALTNVDLCEKNPDLAKKINADGTKNMTLIAKKYNIPFVYISTSAVFDGKNLPNEGYSEEDQPHPANVYAKTKLLGEEIVKENIKDYIIVRGAWMIGGGKKEKKFISYIFDKIKNGETLRVVNDRFGTLTYAKDLLEFVKERLSRKEFGLFHFGSKGMCSRFDIANFIKKEFRSNSIIEPVSSKEFAEQFPAPRPTYEVIKSVKFPLTSSWQTTLKNYMENDLL